MNFFPGPNLVSPKWRCPLNRGVPKVQKMQKTEWGEYSVLYNSNFSRLFRFRSFNVQFGKKKKQGQNGRDKKTNKGLWVSDICWRNGLRDFAKKSHIFLLYKSVYFRYYAMLSRHSNYMTLKCLIDSYRLGYLCPNAYRQPSSDESTSCRHVSSDKGWQYS